MNLKYLRITLNNGDVFAFTNETHELVYDTELDEIQAFKHNTEEVMVFNLLQIPVYEYLEVE